MEAAPSEVPVPPPARQRVVRRRRTYNQWVASQTLEDFALRFTALRARRSRFLVGNTALGPVAFLAMEAIGASLTLAYGFENTMWAIGIFSVLMFLMGLPVAYYAATYGVDIDLLTRGAGFGYLGSTLTSLIYASFTFLLFSIEAGILSSALQLVFGIPLEAAHVLSALAVIPIALHGMRWISRVQLATQPVWLLLQFLPIAYLAWTGVDDLRAWTGYSPADARAAADLRHVGMATAILLSLLPQIGEQVDYLRFLPERTRDNRRGWWTAVLGAGPGWIVPGAFKLLAGSFLAVFSLRHGVAPDHADQPTQMYLAAFLKAFPTPGLALAMTGLFVIVCQIKINVTNAYAGSIAWSNFFSRLTHAHPGRVVWLVFNVVIALFLMESGVFNAVETILLVYANFAAGWIGALTADLIVNKPAGWSPRGIAFQRAYLYDVNPVGVGALCLAIGASSLTLFGAFGAWAAPLSPIVALVTGFAAAVAIAALTDGRYYLARLPEAHARESALKRCVVCENEFDARDTAPCPAYAGTICSLCCTLEARCRDQCKSRSRAPEQLAHLLAKVFPRRTYAALQSRAGRFLGLFSFFNLATALLLLLIYHQVHTDVPADRAAVGAALRIVFLCLTVFSSIAAWGVVLAHESRRAADAESARQTRMLTDEISARQRTDAALKTAKEHAEAANAAKTRFLVAMSHEVRTPLNSIYGYAQLLERGGVASFDTAVRILRTSAEHLARLIDDLLEISNIEMGLVRLRRDYIDLPLFLERIAELFRAQAASKGLDFDFQCSERVPRAIFADQKRLHQILGNLLSNAIKYTRSGGVGLNVHCRGEVVTLEVVDTGPGIAPGELERVFEPFERGSASEIRALPGTGLGLTICKLLVHVMGGEIRVDSTPGAGTRFAVRLMFARAQDSFVPPRPAPMVTGYAGPRRRLLAVDDDPAHLLFLRDLLEPIGFEVRTASSAGDARSAFVDETPDLVLLDISLPDASGWDLARELRRAPGREATRIVLLSAHAHGGRGDERATLHDAFLGKPIETGALLDCIGRLLELRWIEGEARVAAGTPPEAHAPAPLPVHHLDALRRLGQIGHVKGVEARLRQIECEEPHHRALVERLRGLITAFDVRQYLLEIESLRQKI